MSYTWEKSFIISNPLITATINVVGAPEVDQEQTIDVNISNARTIESNGIVVIEIRKVDDTLVTTLESALIVTIGAGSNWTKSYTWTPTEAGDYKVIINYIET